MCTEYRHCMIVILFKMLTMIKQLKIFAFILLLN
jgi:hypothetical protein